MRDRDTIAKELRKREHGIGLHERELQVSGAALEVLLDIRDLLQSLQPKNIIISGGDADGRDQGLHRENHQHS